MYRKANGRANSPPTVQTEPEDLSSPSTVGGPGKGMSNGVKGAGANAAAATAAAKANWDLSNNRLLIFCDIVLQHANYPSAFIRDASCDEEEQVSSGESCEGSKTNILIKNERVSESPLNSVGESARESTRSSTSSTDSVLDQLEPDDTSNKTEYESVSCWCGKPWQGRPMIECETCLIWYHMSCEQVRRNNVPDVFQCSRCVEKRVKKKRSSNGPPGKEESRRGSKGVTKKRKTLMHALSTESGSSSSLSSGSQQYSPAYRSEDNITIKPDGPDASPLRMDISTSLPPVPVSTSTPAKPRQRKTKSNGAADEKKRKSGGAGKSTHLPAENGAPPDFQALPTPPRLLPCVENNALSQPHPAGGAETSPHATLDYKMLIKPDPVKEVPQSTPPAFYPAEAIPTTLPPKLQPQVSSPLGNFRLEHPLGYQNHPSNHHPSVVVVGGGGSGVGVAESPNHHPSS